MEDGESICAVCYTTILGADLEESVIHINCKQRYHRSHIAAWLISNIICPMCREPFAKEIRDSLQPKTQQEVQQLEEVMDEFEGFFHLAGKTSPQNFTFLPTLINIPIRFLSFIATNSIIIVFFLIVLTGIYVLNTGYLELDSVSIWDNIVLLLIFIVLVVGTLFIAIREFKKAETHLVNGFRSESSDAFVNQHNKPLI